MRGWVEPQLQHFRTVPRVSGNKGGTHEPNPGHKNKIKLVWRMTELSGTVSWAFQTAAGISPAFWRFPHSCRRMGRPVLIENKRNTREERNRLPQSHITLWCTRAHKMETSHRTRLRSRELVHFGTGGWGGGYGACVVFREVCREEAESRERATLLLPVSPRLLHLQLNSPQTTETSWLCIHDRPQSAPPPLLWSLGAEWQSTYQI